MLIFFIPGFLLSGLIYYKKDYIKEKYDKWQDLKKIVSVTEKNSIMVNIISLKIVCKMYYENIRKKLWTHKPKLIEKNIYEIEYQLNDKIYTIVFKHKRGPSPILQVFNENEEDVTDKILEYAGPEYNFHGHKFTPKYWGYKSLTFDLDDGTEKTFTDYDNILI